MRIAGLKDSDEGKIGVEGGGNQNARRYSRTQFVFPDAAGDPGSSDE
jgi:hypothetical protein